jgi:cold shock CspA family protein/uncharacterized protein YxeA
MAKGKLQRWNDDRGFGFVISEDGKDDVFLHISDVKNASRRPVVGDIVIYQLVIGDGKTQAVNATIEGLPLAEKKKLKKGVINNSFGAIFFLMVLLMIAFFTYKKFVLNEDIQNVLINSTQDITEVKESYHSDVVTQPIGQTTAYSCDGRQHCSQMSSRAEAEYFLKYCPDTKMDGDNDGIPCENDGRF